MWSLLVIAGVLFQTAAAIFLLNAVRIEDNVDKNLRALLLFLLFHLSTKFLLLAVLGDVFLYTQIPTGFGLAYGPLLLITVLSFLGRPMRQRQILFQFLPFLVFSIVYLSLILTGLAGWVTHTSIVRYTAWYQWLVVGSLCGYPLYVKNLLRRSRQHPALPAGEGRGADMAEGPGADRRGRLLAQIANVFLLGISAGVLLSLLNRTRAVAADFDLRLLPYISFSAIPLLILRYRLQKAGDRAPVPVEQPVLAQPILAQPVPEERFTVVSTDKDKRYEKSGLDASKMDEYVVMLTAFMKKSRIYLDPDLSLETLASRTNMPRHHLTQLLNDRIKKNFYSFINEYRIGEAIDRLNNPAVHVNILSLAFECGFNSRSSFNNYFKKITGSTPTAYRKGQLEQPRVKRGGRPPRLIQDTSPSV
jgi:AraC-like DNA-binding protein